MLSVSMIRSSDAAASYFEKSDDYYSRDSSSPSQWLGEGARTLGLSGAVDAGHFKSILNGQLPTGERLGITRNDEWQHRAGWDLTFSAAKSVSVLALVGQDERLIQAHEQAVRNTLEWVEREVSSTRVRQDGEVRSEKTRNLAVASFRHAMSREKDPQLHTHAVVLNATRSEDGKWRSLDGRELYKIQKQAGLMYRQELAAIVREAGYDLKEARAGNSWSFEIAGVSQNAIDHFSGRSAQVEAVLAARGHDRTTASAREKEVAALDSRVAKDHDVDRVAIRDKWLADAARLGLDVNRIRSVAEERAKSPDFQRQIREQSKIESSRAVNWAVSRLSERDTQFKRSELAQVAFERAEAKASISDIRSMIECRLEDGELIPRPDERITTRQGIEVEKRMLAMEKDGRGASRALSSPSMADREQGIRTTLDKARAVVSTAEAASLRAGYQWTDDQRKATVGLLTDRNRVVGIQGAAGSAKTSTVIRTVAQEFERQGIHVVGMAPTNSASNQLHYGGGIDDAKSLAKHMVVMKSEQRAIAKLRSTGKVAEAMEREAAIRGQAWVVDEASMVSSRQMDDLMKAADRYDARLILVGDTQQLASVGAGRAFAQLQEGGMRTYELNEIVRQRDPALRDAVQDAYRGSPTQALDKVQELGGIVEIRNPQLKDGSFDRESGMQARAQAIARDYSALSAEERAKTIVVAPGHDDRQAINQAVRDALREREQIGHDELKTSVLQSRSLTEAEKRHAGSYQQGNVIRFNSQPGKALREQGLEKGTYASVTGREGDKLTLSIPDGRTVNWNPSARGSGAGKTEAFDRVERGFSVGDRIQLTRNDQERGLTSRSSGTVERIEGSCLSLALAGGKSVDLDVSRDSDRHIEHGYAVTAHAAQGLTAERAFIHAESHRSNLVNMRSLYVGLSRAQDQVRVYTDSFSSLKDAVQERIGDKHAALDERQKDGLVRSAEPHFSDSWNTSTPSDREVGQSEGAQRGLGM